MPDINTPNRQSFSNDQSLGRTGIVKHAIVTPNTKPISMPPRRIPFSKRAIVKDHIDRMLADNIIKPSSSPWGSPIVLASKKDGTQRFCVDYRQQNEATTKDVYPLPRVDDIFALLGGSAVYTALDLEQGFHKIELEEDAKPKTAFNSHLGLKEFQVMPFGLSNGPPTFQRTMEHVLHDLNWHNCFVYLDDVLICSPDLDTHCKDLQNIFERLKAANLKLKLRKCQLVQNKINYLGHIISKEGLRVDPAKTDAIAEMPIPQNIKQLKSFLGLCSYYRRFLQNLVMSSSHLNKLLNKDQPFVWTHECQQNFDQIKQSLQQTTTLAFPDFTKPFIVQTDASKEGIGAVLSQLDGDLEKPIAFASRTLSKPEKNYSTMEQEALAIVWGLKYFRPYIYGHKIILYTDHAPIRLLKLKDDSSPRLVRWIMALQQYDLQVKYRKGSQNQNADALSRLPIPDRQDNTVNTVQFDRNHLIDEQRRDTFLGPIYALLAGPPAPPTSVGI